MLKLQRALLRKQAREKQERTPEYLQDTPALPPNATRGIHDIAESPPSRRSDGLDVYGTTKDDSLGAGKNGRPAAAKDDLEVGRGKHYNKKH